MSIVMVSFRILEIIFTLFTSIALANKAQRLGDSNTVNNRVSEFDSLWRLQVVTVSVLAVIIILCHCSIRVEK